ncbi:MAG: hypothetical protein MJZ68_07440 [archaeon]|nr:hypothetical protein [archaeon]
MENNEAIDGIRSLLDEVIDLHDGFSRQWADHSERNGLTMFNQKKVQVADLERNGLMDTVLCYDSFLSDSIGMDLFSDIEGAEIDHRVKAQNSILEKLEYYCRYSHEKGKVSVNKCFNDLFGIRITLDCPSLRYEDISQCVDQYGDVLAIEDKGFSRHCSETEYLATHIYIRGRGPAEVKNRLFRWELQVWSAHQERNNHLLHERHRFKYRGWERGDGRV